MAGPIRLGVLVNAAQASKALRGLASDADKMGSRFVKTNRSIAAGVGFAIAARGALSLGKAVVSAASDSEQSLGATETVFGRFADKVVKDSNRAATQFGLSANDYRTNANLIGSLFRNQGVATDQLAGKSKAMIKTAADLAATFGGQTSEAVEALGSAFKGEFDPLEKYGISLKQSTVSAEALRVANVKTTSEFGKLSTATQTAAKQQATSNLITKQSARSAGAFARESGTLANQQQVLSARLENVKAKVGTAFLPVLISATSYVSAKVVPALERFATWLGNNQTEISAAAASIGGTLLPALKALGDIAVTVGGFLNALPGPVKEFAAQASLAAAVLPRLTSAVGSVVSPLTNMTGQLRGAETRAAALGTAARNLAGVGGLLAVTQAAQSSNKTLSVLGTTAGGAALGFSLGGPFGAAIGAVGGLGVSLFQMSKKNDAAKASMDASKTVAADYASTLDTLTGATTEATRATAYRQLADSGAIKQLAAYGVSARTAVNATLGQVSASKTVAAALDVEAGKVSELRAERERQANIAKTLGSRVDDGTTKRIADLDREIAARTRTAGAVGRETGAIQKGIAAKRREIAATRDYSGLIGKIPPRKLTRIEATGIEPTRKGIARLSNQLRLTPKQIRAVISETGAKTTVKSVQGVQRALRDTTKTRGKLTNYVGDVTDSAKRAAVNSQKGGQNVRKGLEDPVKKAKADTGAFNNSISSGAAAARGTASTGGLSVGSALKAGVIAGFAGTQSALATAASNAVGAAIAAARARAKIKSPSREMRKVGEQLGDGLHVGMRRRQKAAKKGGRDLVRATLAGVKNGSDGVGGSIDRLNNVILATAKKQTKTDAAANKRAKGVRDRIKSQTAALIANGKAQDAVTNKLNNANAALADLRQQSADYASSVATNVRSYASVLNLDTAFNADALVEGLKSRLAKIQQYNALVADLIHNGLSKTIVDQLAQAGVDGGLATALAIQQGGRAAIAQINGLQGQINAQADSLGGQTAGVMYNAGIQAAAGLVRGLEGQAAQLDRAAVRIGNGIAAAVKKALKIKSPSRVFMDLGKQTGRGLQIGLEGVPVERSGVKVADALVKGFGTPALDAYVEAGSKSGNGAGNTYNITVNAPVGSNPAEIGKTITGYVKAYENAGGRGRAA